MSRLVVSIPLAFCTYLAGCGGSDVEGDSSATQGGYAGAITSRGGGAGFVSTETVRGAGGVNTAGGTTGTTHWASSAAGTTSSASGAAGAGGAATASGAAGVTAASGTAGVGGIQTASGAAGAAGSTGRFDVCLREDAATCGSFGACDQRVTGATTLVLESSWRSATAVRLDDVHLVVASAAASTPPITQALLRVVAFDGCGYAVSAPFPLTTDLIGPEMANSLNAMGALGPNHFFLITRNSSWQSTIHFFRRNGTSLMLLGSQVLDMYEIGGHPVDDTRYLLRHRHSNSADPVYYQLLLRSGDTITFGASVQRPSPTAFPGQVEDEPQGFSPLMRVGPTTFREIRGGYVRLPGNLGSWLLTVGPSNTLTASDPQVYATSGTKTMDPLVAANGTGDGIVLYSQYNGGWHYGYFSGSSFTYHHQGMLNQDGNAYGVYSHESSDGYIGGKYYIRSAYGVVYRFDTLDALATEEARGLVWDWCDDAPPILKMGSWGAFLVCDGTSVSLRFLPFPQSPYR